MELPVHGCWQSSRAVHSKNSKRNIKLSLFLVLKNLRGEPFTKDVPLNGPTLGLKYTISENRLIT